ncbi:DUF3103 family protein [Thermoflexibacter ruber]|uniref:Uncharacterized protein n=1 Tax=Thermoflexibacter ruber TaxID=1003 RepID=A0A1I2DMV2_9BACT|nr:DUF3103 family protein [Thermoflexibacter ruber]SFE81905.1 Protein of unknown function [Thermoflexibacter ruber]
MRLEYKSFDYDEINQNLEKVAFSLAAQMNDPEIRKIIKDEALKQFDGDYDILYNHLKNIKTKDGKSIGEKLMLKNKNIHAQATKIPKFQLSVPINCESWDTENHIPLVVIIPQGKSDKEISRLKAIDYKGNIHFLDAKKVPNEPVVVLNESERTDENGNLLENLVLSTNRNLSNGRLENSAEYLGRIYAPNPSALEAWWDSNLEMRLVVSVRPNGGTPTSVIDAIYNASRTCISEQHSNGQHGCYFGNFLFTWLPSYGQTITYTWIEYDGGGLDTLTFSVSYAPPNSGITSTISRTINRSTWDEHANQSTVWRGEASNTEYGGGSIFSFRIFF